jgi:hypothetical protein
MYFRGINMILKVLLNGLLLMTKSMRRGGNARVQGDHNSN